ncbi:Mu transposase C-terminal domain-containing protein [Nocardia sp. CWNU-33]|uniref:Mu transposase C-terminal domain-containing protein n=1 Tax=Nocardia sp. CWNU-33 TaxID=3392117 RepID=UPI00398F3226
MVRAGVRLGVGTRLIHDGEVAEVIELVITSSGTDVVVKIGSHCREVRRIALRQLLSDDLRVIPTEDGPTSNDEIVEANVALAALPDHERSHTLERAAHVREVLTGYRSGSAELPAVGEPRAEYDPSLSLQARYTAKATELGVGVRTVRRWVADFRESGEAGLVESKTTGRRPFDDRDHDKRWVQTALEVMAEHTETSRPSQSMVIIQTNARVRARFGEGAVKIPSRATAFRVLDELERTHPLFRLSTKRNRDIATRPGGVYGKLRPTRPGEYLMMDTTRLDVFAMDPVTLQWVQAEMTVAMDWYTRCVVGIRVTPVSTKSVDGAATLFQSFRPRPASESWPAHAVWPEHGLPKSVLIDAEVIDGPIKAAAHPAMVPETIVVDHGKIYVSEHLTSVCQRMGISIQPARLRTGRDKGPVERFFRTIREDLLQILPGYKGPDLHSRGVNPESEAFFYLDELEAIIREWVATVYHHRPHSSLVDPQVPDLRMSPAAMFEHGLARAGYIEVPRDPDLGYEFLKVEWRSIQHYGVEFGKRRYNGAGLDPYRNQTSPYTGKAPGRWPIHYHPDDITRAYFRDPETRKWHVLMWEHAPTSDMPFSEDALKFARQLAAAKYTYPDDRLAMADLLERWNLGLGSSAVERRMALRMARETQILVDAEPVDEVSALPSLAKVLALASDEVNLDDDPGTRDLREAADERDRETGDDDEFDDHDLATDDFDEDDYYADALEDV